MELAGSGGKPLKRMGSYMLVGEVFRKTFFSQAI